MPEHPNRYPKRPDGWVRIVRSGPTSGSLAVTFCIRYLRYLYETAVKETFCVHFGGTARRDCHHWRPGGTAAAGRSSGQRGSSPNELQQQFQADRAGDPQLSQHLQASAAARCWNGKSRHESGAALRQRWCERQLVDHVLTLQLLASEHVGRHHAVCRTTGDLGTDFESQSAGRAGSDSGLQPTVATDGPGSRVRLVTSHGPRRFPLSVAQATRELDCPHLEEPITRHALATRTSIRSRDHDSFATPIFLGSVRHSKADRVGLDTREQPTAVCSACMKT